MGICGSSEASDPPPRYNTSNNPTPTPHSDLKEAAEQVTVSVLDGLEAITPTPFNVIFVSINKVLGVYKDVQQNRELSTELLERVKIISYIIVPILFEQTEQVSGEQDGRFTTKFSIKSSADIGVKLTCEQLRTTLDDCVELLKQVKLASVSHVSKLLELIRSPHWKGQHDQACLKLDSLISQLNLAMNSANHQEQKNHNSEMTAKINTLLAELKNQTNFNSNNINQLSDMITANIFDQLRIRQEMSEVTQLTQLTPSHSTPQRSSARSSIINPEQLWFNVGSVAKFEGRDGKMIHHGSIVVITKINAKLVNVKSQRSGNEAFRISPGNLSPVHQSQGGFDGANRGEPIPLQI